MQTLWPIEWPKTIDLSGFDPEQIDIAERFASQALYHLSGRRYGRFTVTVMPCAQTCQHPRSRPLGDPWHPILLETGQVANCFCNGGCSCKTYPSVKLDSPVGGIVEVQVDGAILSKEAYRVENGDTLVRIDGEGWPACAGDRFTVKYWNAYDPGKLGAIAGGYLAAEYLKLFKAGKEKCRLPRGVTSVSRAGINIEIETGMFPGGVTNVQEVDTFLLSINPHALKTPPTIHSIGKRRNRQVTWRGI